MNVTQKAKKALKQLGRNIKNIRTEKKISIKELSQKTRIREKYLIKIESGHAYRVMFEAHLIKIAKVLDVSFLELFEIHL